MNPDVNAVMTTGSWLYMLAVWGVIFAINAYAFSKMFRKKR